MSRADATVAAEVSTLERRTGATYIRRMSSEIQMAEIAALVGDPARANMLAALADGRALTATELAHVSGVSPQTASGHLAKLAQARLLEPVRQGRHRYYRLATPQVGRMLEAIMNVAADAPPRYRPPSPRDQALRVARTCYDHLAGRLGVGLADALCARGHVVLSGDGGGVTPAGASFLSEFGIDLDGALRRRRAFCLPCLDWSERRPHLGGSLGAALAARCLDLGWVGRLAGTRALQITPLGRQRFADVFGLSIA